MIRRARRSARNRRQPSPNIPKLGSFMVPTLTIVANKLRITLDTPFVHKGTPNVVVSGGTHGAGESPTTYTRVSSVAFDLGYATNVVATNVAVIDEADDAIRSQSGGFMRSGSTTLA